MATSKEKTKKIKKISEGRGIIHASFSFNNTKIRLTTMNGNAIGKMVSGGTEGYKNTKKGLAYVAEKVVKKMIDMASDYGVNSVALQLKGIGAGREITIKEVSESSLILESIADVTPIKYGGCRSPKRRRT